MNFVGQLIVNRMRLFFHFFLFIFIICLSHSIENVLVSNSSKLQDLLFYLFNYSSQLLSLIETCNQNSLIG